MQNRTISCLICLIGLRQPETIVTKAEHRLLKRLASKAEKIVEVGVFEGVTSRLFIKNINKNGQLFLVDPYYLDLKLEKLLKLSFNRVIAKRTVKNTLGNQIAKFIYKPSVEAAKDFPKDFQADLIFIDGDHSYTGVKGDFKSWSKHLSKNGVIAFHDSRVFTHSHGIPIDLEYGPAKLMQEIKVKLAKEWKIVEEVDSITVLKRK